MKILYLNMRGVIGEAGRAVRAGGHTLVLRCGCVEALETLRNFKFDAVVIEDDDHPEILHFTVEAHQSHPALPIFVASTWSRGLLKAIEQFSGVGENCGDDAEPSAAGQADSTSDARVCDEEFCGQEKCLVT